MKQQAKLTRLFRHAITVCHSLSNNKVATGATIPAMAVAVIAPTLVTTVAHVAVPAYTTAAVMATSTSTSHAYLRAVFFF